MPLRDYISVDASTWAADGDGGLGFGNLSLAGWWNALISVPIFQFMLVRWYFRMFIGPAFSGRSRASSSSSSPPTPIVPAAGFLANIVYAFTPLLLAHGALLAGLIADRIFFAGAKLPQFALEIAGCVGVHCCLCCSR